MLAEGPSPSDLDHDFHIHGVVPSVTFIVDIPESANDSFYQGQAYACLKDKVLQPSSSLRQCRAHYSGDGVVPTKPILVSDGGPDHCITYASVQVALFCSYPLI